MDDTHACLGALNRILESREQSAVSLDNYRDQFHFPVQRYYETLGFRFPDDDWHDISVTFYAHYDELTDGTGLRHGAREVLAALQETELAMAVLSMCEVSQLRRMVRARAVEHHFDHVYGLGTLYADCKKALGQQLFQEAGMRASEVLLIGDTTHDHEVAEELGCECLLLVGGHMSEERLAACGRPVADDMEAVLAYIKDRC